MWVRGTITGLDGDVLSVKSREGKDLKIKLSPKFGVRYAKALTLADIKPGDFVGPASRKRADGTLEAISLQVFTPDRRGQVPEGHMPWDLEPGSLMTNAIVAGMVQTSKGRELTLKYGRRKSLRPQGSPRFTALPGDRSMLVRAPTSAERAGRPDVLCRPRAARSARTASSRRTECREDTRRCWRRTGPTISFW
jgi:hypothetical protein